MVTGVRKMDPVSRGRLAKHAATMTPAAGSYLFRSMVAFLRQRADSLRLGLLTKR
jgi:hypothetical protein